MVFRPVRDEILKHKLLSTHIQSLTGLLLIHLNDLVNFKLTQISTYGVVCSICFANLRFDAQEAKTKNNGIKIIDNHFFVIDLVGITH